ncbi:MAG: glycoside hydrolase family 5 protein [Chloroflexi bacterium]|nr:glycoside hydrolase family 5 protein [Chloroflexota bacterium]
MKAKFGRNFFVILIPILSLCAVLGYLAARSGHLSLKLPVDKNEQFSGQSMSVFPSRLHASGNQIVDESGKVILLRGLMPQDPDKLNSRGKFKREFFEEMMQTGANVIRIPVHVERWVNDEYYLWRYLDPVVAWAGEMGMYVIIDWHSIGNVVSGAGSQMPDVKQNSMDLALSFWSTTARYFREAPHVIFEIFNEPESIDGAEWKAGAEKLIQAIREQGAEQMVIVGGIDFGKDLSWVWEIPVSESNLAYASHIYPSHSSSNWDEWFGDIAERYPVVSTEWGFMDENRTEGPSYLAGTRADYGEPFLNYLDARGIGWVACWYDDEWLPPMFAKNGGQLTQYGQFVLEYLNNKD